MVEEVAALSVRLSAISADFERGMKRAVQVLNRQTTKMERKVGRSTKKMDRSVKRLDDRFAKLGSTFGLQLNPRIIVATAALAAFGKAIRDIVRSGDEIRQLEGRFKALTGSAERAGTLLAAAFDISLESGASLEAASGGLTRFTIAGKEIGAADEEVVQFTKNLLKLGAVGGKSVQEVRSGVIQLGQAMAKGRLDGDELRSVMENLPLVAILIAKAFGVGIGQIKKLGEEGKLLADPILKGVLAETENINTQFEALGSNIERSANRAATAWTRFAAVMDKLLGTSAFVSGAFEDIATNLTIANKFMERKELAAVAQALLDARLRAKELKEELAAAEAEAAAFTETAKELKFNMASVSLADAAVKEVEKLKIELEAVRRLVLELSAAEITIRINRLKIKPTPQPTEGPAGFIAEQEANTPVPAPRPGGAGAPIDLQNELAFNVDKRKRGEKKDTAAIDFLDALRVRLDLLTREIEIVEDGNLSLEELRAALVKLNAEFDKERALRDLSTLAAKKGITVSAEQREEAEKRIDNIETETVELAKLNAGMEKKKKTDKDREKAEEDFRDNVEQTTESMVNAALEAKSFGDAILGIVTAMVNGLIRAQGGDTGGGGIAGGIGGLAGLIIPALLGAAGSGGAAAGSAQGNVFSGGNVVPFARGGIVDSPTVFPMKNRIGLLGESGPEAILPLKRGPGGKLGVESSGGGGNVTVEIHNNFALGLNAEIRAEIAAATPSMVQAAKIGVADAMQRGGRFKKVMR